VWYFELEIVYEDFEVNLTSLTEAVVRKHELLGKKGNPRLADLLLNSRGVLQFATFLEVAFSIRNTTKFYEWFNMDWVFLTATGELKVMIPFFHTSFETDFQISLEDVISVSSPLARTCYSSDKMRRSAPPKTPNEAKQGNSQYSNHNIFVCGFFLLFNVLPAEQALKAKFEGQTVDFTQEEVMLQLFNEVKAASCYTGNERLIYLLFKLLVSSADCQEDTPQDPVICLLMHFQETQGSQASLNDLSHLLSWLKPLDAVDSSHVTTRTIYLPQNIAVLRNNLVKNGKSYHFSHDGQPILELLCHADSSFTLKCHYSDLCWMEATLDCYFNLRRMQVFTHVEENYFTEVNIAEFEQHHFIPKLSRRASDWNPIISWKDNISDSNLATLLDSPPYAIFDEYQYKRVYDRLLKIEQKGTSPLNCREPKPDQVSE
jgi:hypothetical protein